MRNTKALEPKHIVDVISYTPEKGLFDIVYPGEGVVPEQADQVQATEAGGGGTRQPAEEEGKPPHQQMAHRHQAVQLRRHRRDLRGLKPRSNLRQCCPKPCVPF